MISILRFKGYIACLFLLILSFASYGYDPYLVKDINPYFDNLGDPLGSSPSDLTSVDGKLFFIANDGDTGRELWISDGSDAGTVLVTEIEPGPEPLFGHTDPRNLTDVNGFLFFSAIDPVYDLELFRSDGTESGTGLVVDIDPAGGSNPRFLFNLDGIVLFSARDDSNENGLWRSDGTAPGTFRLRSDMQFSGDIASLNGIAFFMGIDERGQELWRTDGTESGTFLVKNITDVDSAGGSPYAFTPMGNEMFFVASDYDISENYIGLELWKTDGTALGTVMVKDINPGFNSSLPDKMAALNGLLYFSADDDDNPLDSCCHDLWVTDGTEAGTHKIKDFDTHYDGIDHFTPVGNTMFFTADDGVHGPELWKSDGTEAGTVMVKDIIPEAGAGIDVWKMLDVNGTLFFSFVGFDLWTSDGTESGTVQIVPDPNTEGGSISDFELVDNTLFISGQIYVVGNKDLIGRELWALDVSAPSVDSDGDGYADEDDNCPATANPDQSDLDGDGNGDACDAFPNDPLNDVDGDGYGANEDNCPETYNPSQADSNGNGVGDACDPEGPDVDGDGFEDSTDNCPKTFNPDQNDKDGDGWGDVCDTEGKYGNNDSDGDGVVNRKDNCPHIFNDDQSDIDEDYIGDACDVPGDFDGDTVFDSEDNCPLNTNSSQSDLDNDGIGDACDDDIDGDGYHNKRDKCPAQGSGTLDRHGCPI